jgi:hypothetical protein
MVQLDGNTVTVLDRAGFERSQIVAKRVYVPQEGTYFRKDNPALLLDPVSVGLAFGPGQPDDTRQVYYPEKTVLAFFSDLGGNTERAMGNVCGDAKNKPKYDPQEFGLTVAPRQLKRVVVCEMSYVPDVRAEQNHEERVVRVRLEEIENGGSSTCQNPQTVQCYVRSNPNPKALPYGCEWCLQSCEAVP